MAKSWANGLVGKVKINNKNILTAMLRCLNIVYHNVILKYLVKNAWKVAGSGAKWGVLGYLWGVWGILG